MNDLNEIIPMVSMVPRAAGLWAGNHGAKVILEITGLDGRQVQVRGEIYSASSCALNVRFEGIRGYYQEYKGGKPRKARVGVGHATR